MTAFAIDATGDAAAEPLQFEEAARSAEAAGFDGVVALETRHDPFLLLALAARATERIQLATGIAVAFARSPMTIAVAANDIQSISGGRFALGLGSQVQAHIERRFSMPWSSPAKRMREYVAAVRAIWAAWATGERLKFEGEFYQHTLMSPFFDPGPNPHGNPPIWLAAVGEGMAETAGAVADGIICHSFTTERYLREVTMPAIARGQESSGRVGAFDVSVAPFVAVGRDQRELDRALVATRRQIAFYASTPAYRSVLELHGWGEAGDQLNALSRRGDWEAMGALVTDDMVEALAVVGTPDQIAAEIRERFGGVATRLSFYLAHPVTDEVMAELLAATRAG